MKTKLKKTNWSHQGDTGAREDLFLASGEKGRLWHRQNSRAETHIPHSPEQASGKQCWLRDPVRPCVFWVITGFGIPSAGRGQCGRNQRAGACPSLGPDTPPPPLRPPHPSPLIHSLCAPSPPPPVTVCVSTCPSQTAAPSEEFTLFLPPFALLLFHFLFFFFFKLLAFSFSLSFLFDTRNTPPPSLCCSHAT